MPQSLAVDNNGSGSTARQVHHEDAQQLLKHAIVRENKDLPEVVEDFKIVLPHTGDDAYKNEKLTPPQFEYPEGVYLIMAPGRYHENCPFKNDCDMTTDDYLNLLPTHLRHYRYVATHLPFGTPCKWTLSGPQYSRKGAVQQRYCYPKGQEKYASSKGAGLYTVYDAKGTEIVNYRVLHVYFSSKRANSESAKNEVGEQSGRTVPSPKKKVKRQSVTSPRKIESESLRLNATGSSSDDHQYASLLAFLDNMAHSASMWEVEGVNVPDYSAEEVAAHASENSADEAAFTEHHRGEMDVLEGFDWSYQGQNPTDVFGLGFSGLEQDPVLVRMNRTFNNVAL